MQFTCVYASGKEFGTGNSTSNYAASVTSTKDKRVAVRFDFRAPNQGKSRPSVTNASVRSLSLNLTQAEALQFAASIIAQAHHPTIHDSSARWIPPAFMPPLTKNRWSRKLKLKFESWNKKLIIENNTKFHIGTVQIAVRYQSQGLNSNSLERSVEANQIVDLPPGGVKTIDIQQNVIPSHHRKGFVKILSVDVIEVTGIIPGQT